jgi:hypothetical protein
MRNDFGRLEKLDLKKILVTPKKWNSLNRFIQAGVELHLFKKVEN